MFRNDIIELPQLVRIDGEQRFYQTPDGNKYPSVTTVLSEMSDKTAIIKWRKRVGDAEADRVSGRATRRGTAVHTLLEKLVLNEEIDFSDTMPLNMTMYNQIAEFLKEHVNDVRSSEGQLFSHKLKIAGSVDLIASYKGEPAIISLRHRQSLSVRSGSKTTSYRLQCTPTCSMR